MQQSIYTVYLTTNIVNNKIYVGVHKTSIPYDDYLGSGDQVKRAIKKYGIENFDKQIIAIFHDAKSAYVMESKIVTQEFVDSNMTYNIKLGGHGGWEGVSVLGGNFIRDNKIGIHGYDRSLKIAISKLGRIGLDKKYPNGTFHNKTHSSKTKSLMSEKAKIHQKGAGNSQYGSFWITNGVSNSKCRGAIPDGWYKGRRLDGIRTHDVCVPN